MKKNRYNMIGRRVVILFTFLFSLLTSFAQYEKWGGVYYAYPIESGQATPFIQDAPEGFEPFYISHYGRHGSRWVTSDNRYIWVNQQFEDQKNLTKLGKDALLRLSPFSRPCCCLH